MVYILFLLFTCWYLAKLHRYRSLSAKQLYAYFFPIVIFWVLLIGGQYNVGTDYFDYFEIFNGDLHYIADNRGEVVFAAFVRFCNSIGIYGQGVFVVLSAIWVMLLIRISSYITDSRYTFLFLFVFIVFPGIFHNQMNGVRQYFAVYLFTLSLCSFFARKYKTASLLIVLMIFIHISSILALSVFVISLLLLNHIIKHPKWLYHIVIASFVLSQILSAETIGGFLRHFTNIHFIETYALSYFNTGRVDRTGLVFAITKYIYIPLILYAIHLYGTMSLSDTEKKLFIIGICGYCFKLSIVSISIIHRMGQYFDIVMCIPMTYMLRSLLIKKRKRAYYTVIAYLLIPYVFKVTAFAVGEYQYHSIFFH